MPLDTRANVATKLATGATITSISTTSGTPTVLLGPIDDIGMVLRNLSYLWTGDQTINLLVQMEFGDGSAGSLGYQTVLKAAVGAGNGTTQSGLIFPVPTATVANGTFAFSGSACTITVCGTTNVLTIPCAHIQIAAYAAGAPTVGSLLLNLNEAAYV